MPDRTGCLAALTVLALIAAVTALCWCAGLTLPVMP